MPPKATTKRASPVKKKTAAKPKAKWAARVQAKFPIVAIGASAGGLEALEQFLGATPEDCGIAFVVIQHLDPHHKDMLPKLLQNTTSMPVAQVRDRMSLQPNRVYVIPPNKDLSILHGKLHLLKPTKTKGLHLPIDYFFRSLAQDQQDKSIGVILSGMGSDGSLGLQAIKEQSGLVLVQEPSTAKFDGMPSSAIHTNLVDIIAPTKELPMHIIESLKRKSPPNEEAESVEDAARSALEKIIILLRDHSGNDFSLYKENTLLRQIERRMGIHKINDYSQYVRYLHGNSQEIGLLFQELLIGVTSFFRDPEVWDTFATQALPNLLKNNSNQRNFRAWIPGCSTGEEAFTLAMILIEATERLKPNEKFKLQIFATDLNKDAIEKARLGLFPEKIASEISKERLDRFFSKQNKGYLACKELRQMIVFAPQNITMDAPFTKLDIVSCRNLLIYLSASIQKKIIPLFHYILNPKGILLLGSSESVGKFTNLFIPLDNHARMYLRTQSEIKPDISNFPTAFGLMRSGRSEKKQISAHSLQSLADDLILKQYAPPAVLVNEVGDILYVSGHTGKYLEAAAGKANWNLFSMAHEDLHYELSAAFHKALQHPGSTEFEHTHFVANNCKNFTDIKVKHLLEPPDLKGLLLVSFTDTLAPPAEETPKPVGSAKAINQIKELRQELSHVRTEARSNEEAVQILKEEYHSANEELQSTNQDLQSTNEEVSASKEEMQSLNEELQTLNAELQSRLDELNLTSTDMKNLLDSTDIAILFLDKKLKIRRFTPQTTKIIKLIPSDIGRPISDLSSEINDPQLLKKVNAVMHSVDSQEEEILISNQRWYNLRIVPYRTMNDQVDGVVMTFSDITIAKRLEAKLRQHNIDLQEDLTQQIDKDNE